MVLIYTEFLKYVVCRNEANLHNGNCTDISLFVELLCMYKCIFDFIYFSVWSYPNMFDSLKWALTVLSNISA